jgi:hypothetical protein
MVHWCCPKGKTTEKSGKIPVDLGCWHLAQVKQVAMETPE